MKLGEAWEIPDEFKDCEKSQIGSYWIVANSNSIFIIGKIITDLLDIGIQPIRVYPVLGKNLRLSGAEYSSDYELSDNQVYTQVSFEKYDRGFLFSVSSDYLEFVNILAEFQARLVIQQDEFDAL